MRALTSSAVGVAMVGDGVNDAPATATATLGIAVVLVSDDVEKVDYVIHLGQRARRVVRQNVYFSVGWMALLVVAAVTVGIPLPLAVVAHEGSTLVVALNGLRLLGGSPHPPVYPGVPRPNPPSPRPPHGPRLGADDAVAGAAPPRAQNPRRACPTIRWVRAGSGHTIHPFRTKPPSPP